MFVVNAIDVVVRDVVDESVIAAVQQTVRGTFGHLVGQWHVDVSAPHQPARWNLRIRGGFGHHVAAFWADPDRLPEFVERKLRAFLRGRVSSLDAAPAMNTRMSSRRRARPRVASDTAFGAPLSLVQPYSPKANSRRPSADRARLVATPKAISATAAPTVTGHRLGAGRCSIF